MPFATPQKACCIRCNAQSDTALMLPLVATRATDEVASIFIHAECAQSFVIDQLHKAAHNIKRAKTAGSNVADLGAARTLKGLERLIDTSLQTLHTSDWSP